MKQDTIRLIFQPSAEHSYWADRILEGVKSAAKDCQDGIRMLDPFEPPSVSPDQFVLVAGNRIDWLENTVSALLAASAHPVIVNACMLPLPTLRCSGVVFELEECLSRCLESLKAEEKRCALLGTASRSASDQSKEKAFLRQRTKADLYPATGSLEDCVRAFVARLDSDPYDAVICANDTVALRLLSYLEGKEKPEVIGMGNSFVGQERGLTSIEFDYFEMGRAAVRLLHLLKKSPSDCHLLLSLPCRIAVRESARLILTPQRNKAPDAPTPPTGYFEGEAVQTVILVEAMLQSGDKADRQILLGLARGEGCEQIAQRLFFSDRAVRYRIKKLLTRYGFPSRAALEEALRTALSSKNT